MVAECKSDENAPAGACSHLTNCPMFAAFETEATGRIFRQFYCEGKFQTCARFQKSERGESVPDLLLPNGAFLKAR